MKRSMRLVLLLISWLPCLKIKNWARPVVLILQLRDNIFPFRPKDVVCLSVGKSLSSLFDIAHFRQPFFDKSYSLGYMRPIVWFAEYCFVELAMADKVFRQAFWHGSPLGQQSELRLGGKPATIGLCKLAHRAVWGSHARNWPTETRYDVLGRRAFCANRCWASQTS